MRDQGDGDDAFFGGDARSSAFELDEETSPVFLGSVSASSEDPTEETASVTGGDRLRKTGRRGD